MVLEGPYRRKSKRHLKGHWLTRSKKITKRLTNKGRQRLDPNFLQKKKEPEKKILPDTEE